LGRCQGGKERGEALTADFFAVVFAATFFAAASAESGGEEA
jgi:hypothetical protein